MEKQLAHSDFKSIQIFNGLNDIQLEKILTSLVYRVRQYAAGETIMQRGDQVDSFVAVIDGELIGEMQVAGSNDLRIEHIEKGQLVASAILFSEGKKLPVDLIARQASRLLYIHRQDFLHLLKSNEQVLLNFLQIISGKGQFLAQKLHFLTFRDLRQKVATWLLDQCGEGYNGFEMKDTQEGLARLFGVARTSLVRAMQSMQDDGLIKIERKWIECLDKERLKAL